MVKSVLRKYEVRKLINRLEAEILKLGPWSHDDSPKPCQWFKFRLEDRTKIIGLLNKVAKTDGRMEFKKVKTNSAEWVWLGLQAVSPQGKAKYSIGLQVQKRDNELLVKLVKDLYSYSEKRGKFINHGWSNWWL